LASRWERSSLSSASAFTWSPYSSRLIVGAAMCDPYTLDLTVSRLEKVRKMNYGIPCNNKYITS